MIGGQNILTHCVLLADIYQFELDPLNKDLPAILMPIGNVPAIEMLLHHLYYNDIKILYILHSKQNEKIKTYVQQSRFVRKVREIETYDCICGMEKKYCTQQMDEKPLMEIKFVETISDNPVCQLNTFFEELDEEKINSFLLINGPVVFNFSIQNMFLYHESNRQLYENKYLATIAIQRIESDSFMHSVKYPFYIETNEKNKLLKYHNFNYSEEECLNFITLGTKSTISIEYEPTSIYIVQTHEFLNIIKEEANKKTTSLTEVFSEALGNSQGISICTYDIRNYCAGRIDCPRAYRGINRAYINRQYYPYTPDQNIYYKFSRKVEQQEFGEATIGKQLKLIGKLKGLSIVGNNCKIEGEVDASILGDECHIYGQAVIKDCIIGDKVTINKNAYLLDCIILDLTTVRENVCLPKGTIVGSNIENLTTEVVFHSIRCFAQTVWGESIYRYLDKCVQLNKIAKEDVDTFKRFVYGQELTLVNNIILVLPPIFICKEYISKIELEREKNIRQLYSSPSKNPRTETYELSLAEVPDTPEKPINNDYIEDDDISELISQPSEEYSSSTESNDSHDAMLFVPNETCDEFSPSRLAPQIIENKDTLLTTQHWIPRALIEKAKETTELERLEEEFIKIQLNHGFHFIPIQIIHELPYSELYRDTEKRINNANKKILVYSKYSIAYYENNETLKNIVELPVEEKNETIYNMIAKFFLQLEDNMEFEKTYIKEEQTLQKSFALDICQELQFFCISAQSKKELIISLELPIILIVLAIHGSRFKGFDENNKPYMCTEVNPDAALLLNGFLRLLTESPAEFDAPMILEQPDDPMDLVINITTALFENLIAPKFDGLEEIVDDEQLEDSVELVQDLLECFVDCEIILDEDIKDWIENEEYAEDEVNSPEFLQEPADEKVCYTMDYLMYKYIGLEYHTM